LRAVAHADIAYHSAKDPINEWSAMLARDKAVAAYRATPLISRSMASTHPVGNFVRNLSTGVSTASIFYYSTVDSFGAGYGAMQTWQRVALGAPSVMALANNSNFMYQQVKRLSDMGSKARLIAERAALTSQSSLYPAASMADMVTAGMAFSTGHHAEGAAYAVRSAMSMTMWRLVMGRGPSPVPNPLYKHPVIGPIIRPQEPLNPSFKHWATIATIAGLFGASTATYLLHEQAPTKR
jgi:hypothetical protein